MTAPAIQPCSTCIFKGSTGDAQNPGAVCRKNSPAALLGSSGAHPHLRAVWPKVDPSIDGCGDGRPVP